MVEFVMNKISNDEVDILITILDYEKLLSENLKKIEIKNDKLKTVLVDTAIYSGLNQYRFIKFRIIDSKIDFMNPTYLTPSDVVLEFSNKILKLYPKCINNSVMTNKQKQLLLMS
ncbi:type II toxin-antitoxin system RnlB family antitoxin [Globicatella sp. PHS-GS-PNBC-21-1553]|uniref:type II toxin-antitoxin system RnlB family antitoxin n=1 Tax=Globicatella sp. PHS-GS-PNBC-21-1553 TaxID=2885764 RepID=UPI00298F144F|nr:type II toxin-antitoxin system RnlB family antitoxin [Globicatella sp. PHS-GS-PNBC-21-1553]WPC08792.1 type II toxin-antitoxin system RnlB family antitoxin [Globicatella sp. PHS-GS-PNBC-21-1553]